MKNINNIARLIIEGLIYFIDRKYDYLIPDDMIDQVKVGSRVRVVFGQKRQYSAIITEITDHSDYRDKLKPILSTEDDFPIFNAEQLKLTEWLKQHYFCSYWDAASLLLPKSPLTSKRRRSSSDKSEKPTKASSSVSIIEELNDEQQEVFTGLSMLVKSSITQTALLFGITGSGKTSVYLKLAYETIKAGKSVIILVPEIALTPGLKKLVYSIFGDTVAVVHSGLTVRQRTDEYRRILYGEAKVVVGTRSAIFAPVSSLGLIIIDEEQEHTYKSEMSPKCYTHEVAAFRAAYHGATLLLVSATPDIRTYYRAVNGRIKLFKLTKRYGEAKLPEVRIADMREEMLTGNKTMFSETLRESIEHALSEKKQVILFINRRGYNTFVSCRECGYVVMCTQCSVAMTYHKAGEKLKCHYCGLQSPNVKICPSCGSIHIRHFGTGTQKIEHELQTQFPEAKVIRMDMDTTEKRDSHEHILQTFADPAENYDILLGTQMVTKGLDFDKVSLVGVMAADMSLFMDDYRANERTFSLLTQVVGRAGRRSDTGGAVIQTFCPDNHILSLAVKQDYEAFYKSEIGLRKLMLYPPFCDLCQAVFTGSDEERPLKAAEYFSDELKRETESSEKIPIRIMQPGLASVAKVKNKFRAKVLIKCKNDRTFRNMMDSLLHRFYEEKQFADISVSIDINPFSVV